MTEQLHPHERNQGDLFDDPNLRTHVVAEAGEMPEAAAEPGEERSPYWNVATSQLREAQTQGHPSELRPFMTDEERASLTNALVVPDVVAAVRSRISSEVAAREAQNRASRARADRKNTERKHQLNSDSQEAFRESHTAELAAQTATIEQKIEDARKNGESALSLHYLRKELESAARAKAAKAGSEALDTHVKRAEATGLTRKELLAQDAAAEEQRRQEKAAEVKAFQEHIGANKQAIMTPEVKITDNRQTKVERPEGISEGDWIRMGQNERREAVANANRPLPTAAEIATMTPDEVVNFINQISAAELGSLSGEQDKALWDRYDQAREEIKGVFAQMSDQEILDLANQDRGFNPLAEVTYQARLAAVRGEQPKNSNPNDGYEGDNHNTQQISQQTINQLDESGRDKVPDFGSMSNQEFLDYIDDPDNMDLKNLGPSVLQDAVIKRANEIRDAANKQFSQMSPEEVLELRDRILRGEESPQDRITEDVFKGYWIAANDARKQAAPQQAPPSQPLTPPQSTHPTPSQVKQYEQDERDRKLAEFDPSVYQDSLLTKKAVKGVAATLSDAHLAELIDYANKHMPSQMFTRKKNNVSLTGGRYDVLIRERDDRQSGKKPHRA